VYLGGVPDGYSADANRWREAGVWKWKEVWVVGRRRLACRFKGWWRSTSRQAMMLVQFGQAYIGEDGGVVVSQGDRKEASSHEKRSIKSREEKHQVKGREA
jgi:hypothetical protein